MTATNTIEFLFSDAAKAGRMQRVSGYTRHGQTTPTGVVHLETQSGTMVELDADDVKHAEHIIEAWITNHMAISARHHGFLNDGTLVRHSPIYDFGCYQNVDY